MDLIQLLDNLGVLKAITHNFKYVLFGLAGALIQVFFMKKNGQAVTWSLLALIVIAAITFSVLLGATLKGHVPEGVLWSAQTLVGFTSKSVLDYIDKRFNPRNIGDTMRAISELLLNLIFPKK
jgi:hypothetical protein